MTTEYGQRLIGAMAYATISQKELREKAGIAQSTLASAMSRGSGSRYTAVFAEICGVSAAWLATGKGMMIETAPAMERFEPIGQSEMARDIATTFDLIKSVRTKAIVYSDISEMLDRVIHESSLPTTPEQAPSVKSEKAS